jgi:hypothetical protein
MDGSPSSAVVTTPMRTTTPAASPRRPRATSGFAMATARRIDAAATSANAVLLNP